MASFNQILVLSAVTLLALAGCDSAKEASTPQTSPTPVPAATAVVKTEKAAPQGNYAELSAVVSSTKAAVQTGDFVKAKTEFDKFENAWKKVEDGIKAKAPKSYEAVEDSAEKVTDGLKKGQSSKDKVLAQLDSLETTVNSIPKM
ncbi:DUF4363 domain-containing protein [Microcoleus sp. LEGE 07076]|uniref:DUF4363 domain-containing protein n=1 Tax=Microcoleus sp. LEGE 07076 TaxID=915322 RepID=UPI001882EBC5|nr:DUF4363 domain-containing protein [Microcoleus sp. LEGE 07076]MBE9184818.1 DUF4363 domain-containing protein [Microcoleus sp. LEGE 07076]